MKVSLYLKSLQKPKGGFKPARVFSVAAALPNYAVFTAGSQY
jgi:hypothetical protein